MTTIIDINTEDTYTLEEFADRADEIYAGCPECAQAAHDLVDAIGRHEWYGGYASFLAVEVH